jgi:hypothetical protein
MSGIYEDETPDRYKYRFKRHLSSVYSLLVRTQSFEEYMKWYRKYIPYKDILRLSSQSAPNRGVASEIFGPKPLVDWEYLRLQKATENRFRIVHPHQGLQYKEYQ